MACAIVLRLADKEEDILRIIRLARLDFLSAFSSPVEDDEPAVGGGDRAFPRSRLDVETRLLMDIGRWCAGEAWTDGGRDDERTDGEATDGSIVIDRRRSVNEDRRSLIRSLIMEIEDLRSFVVVVLEEVDNRLSFERRRSWIVSLGG